MHFHMLRSNLKHEVDDTIKQIFECTYICLTSVCGIERSEGDDKEGGGIFPSIHQVREGPLGVTVTPQALDEAEPGRQTLDDGAQTVRVAMAYVVVRI